MTPTLITLVLTVHHYGDAAIHDTHCLIGRADFRTPFGRLRAVGSLSRLFPESSVVDGFVNIRRVPSMNAASRQAGGIARTQMHAIDLKPDVIHLAEHGFPQRSGVPSGMHRVLRDNRAACLIGLVATVWENGARNALPRHAEGAQATFKALRRLGRSLPGELDALYLYVTPGWDEPLSPDDAAWMLETLRETVAAPVTITA